MRQNLVAEYADIAGKTFEVVESIKPHVMADFVGTCSDEMAAHTLAIYSKTIGKLGDLDGKTIDEFVTRVPVRRVVFDMVFNQLKPQGVSLA
jgi:hypothetical protein